MGFNFKLLFFDTKEVKSRVSEATRKILSKFGAFVRQTAKQSIKTKPTSRFGRGRERCRARAQH